MEGPLNDKTATVKETARQDPKASSSADLSREIERAVDRQPADTVRCVRVFGNYYRCNWWCRAAGQRVGPEYNWAGNAMDCIRTSRFLTATMHAGELVIEEVRSSVSSTVIAKI